MTSLQTTSHPPDLPGATFGRLPFAVRRSSKNMGKSICLDSGVRKGTFESENNTLAHTPFGGTEDGEPPPHLVSGRTDAATATPGKVASSKSQNLRVNPSDKRRVLRAVANFHAWDHFRQCRLYEALHTG